MKPRTRSILLFVLDVLLNAAVIIFLVIVLRFFVIAPFRVSGSSMCDTFNNFDGRCVRGDGEYIILYKLGYQNFFGWQLGTPDRGDIVVFQPPESDDPDEYFIKRVIGLPGDTIEFKDGYVYITNEEYPEGWMLPEEDYLNQVNLGNTEPQTTTLSVLEVPEGSYFVMGDNRKASSDSRSCFVQAGCNDKNSPYLTMEDITGKAWLVLWPFDRMRVIDEVVYEEAL